MKKITVVAAVLLIAHAAHAAEQEVSMVEVEVTPMAPEKPSAGEADTRFASYALESFGCCGLQQPAGPEGAPARPATLSASHGPRPDRATHLGRTRVQLVNHPLALTPASKDR